MGGVNPVVALQLGSTALNLLDNSKEKKRQSDYLTQSYQASVKRKQNLLEQQLASRRAALGASGAAGGKSSLAVQNRLINDAYDEITEDTAGYKKQYASLRESNLPAQILQSVTSINKIIK